MSETSRLEQELRAVRSEVSNLRERVHHLESRLHAIETKESDDVHHGIERRELGQLQPR